MKVWFTQPINGRIAHLGKTSFPALLSVLLFLSNQLNAQCPDPNGETVNNTTGQVQVCPGQSFTLSVDGSSSFNLPHNGTINWLYSTNPAFDPFTSGTLLGQSAITNTPKDCGTLAAGDIAFVSFQGDDPDQFSFVALANIAAGAQINFTDDGWKLPENTFRTGEGVIVWTAPAGGVSVGTVVTISFGPLAATVGTAAVVTGSFALSTSGDQIIAFCGVFNTSTGAITGAVLAGVQFNAATWDATASTANSSGLPLGLTNGASAIAVGNVDNGKFNCSGGSTSGTAVAVSTTLNTSVNWTTSETILSPSVSPCAYYISGATVTPLTTSFSQAQCSQSQYIKGIVQPLAGACSQSAATTTANLNVLVTCLVLQTTLTHPTCANNDGQIDLSVSSGALPYSYDWADLPGSSDPEDRSSLAAGTYFVTVTDFNGCSATASVTLNPAAGCGCPSLSSNVTNTTCGASNGAIEILATGGLPPFQFNIGSGAQSSPLFGGLSAGTYTVTVTGSDCQGVTIAATVQALADTEAPVFNGTLPTNIIINCSDPVPAAVALTATDNCDPNPSVQFSQTATPGTCPQEQTISRSWTASDISGNSTQHVQTITVVDDQAPVFNLPLPANVTLSCEATIPLAANVTASDNCDPGVVPPVIFINEIHYDNVGVDVGEFIEVAGTAGINLADYQLVLYNGNGGVSYNELTLSGIIDNEGGGFGAVSFAYPANGIQNGTPDGVALVKLPNTVIQFLSYEGPFLATNGAAAGMTATDIVVIEDGSNAIGTSLQLTGNGQQYSNFIWTGPIAQSPGTLNTGQTISPLPGTITATLMETTMMGTCDGERTIMRVYTATDACGNSTAYTQTISMEDNTPPAFTPPLPQNITVNCSDPVPPPANMTAVDNCDNGTPDAVVWINEIHYDNVGTDANEFIEVAGTAGTDLSGYSIFLYNGAGGGTYGSMVLTGILDNESNGFGALSFPYPVNGIQNGAPDGLALVHGGMVLQYLSYEGTFTAVGGPANGMLSTDIGVLEDGTNAVGTSLSLTGNGNTYANFTWNPPAPSTPGSLNTGQTMVAVPTGLVVSFSQNTVPGTCPNTSTITRSWSVSDGCGNSTSLVQVVSVRDLSGPVFTFVPASAAQQCNTNIPPLGAPTATDNCDTQVSIVYNGETVTPGNCLNSSTIVRKWTASDDCGNTTTAVQTIAVNDTQGPSLVCQNIAVNLNIFGTVSVNVASLIQSLSDNCSPNNTLVVTPAGPLTYTCAQQGTTVPVTITATDQCGNVSSCVAQVTVNPFVRCTPKILVSDPCVCKNNATTLDNGQFGETLKIESLAGKTWKITAVNGLYSAGSPNPPLPPVGIVLGTAFVENPVNSGDYFFSGIHVDAIGYSITVTSEKGEVLTISNACQYPNPVITSDLSGPFCLYSDPVPLTGDPGDGNFTSAEFTVNGTPATTFNPGAGVGQYVIEYTVNGGTPKAAGANDPGCIQKVQKIVNVLATPSALVCNDLVEISLDEDCSTEVTPDMILEGTYFCYDDYSVTITGLNGTPNFGNTVTGNNIGQTLKATVTHLVSGNTCWGQITVEDKLPPVLQCTPVTVSCGILNCDPYCLKNSLGISNAVPTVVENCGNYYLSYVDDWVDLPCGGSFNGVQDLSAYVRRVWTATDNSGNKSSCTQFIYFKRKHVGDVLFPSDTILSCQNPATDPAYTGSPYILDFGQKIPLYPGDTYCEIQTVYVDQILPVCDGSYKILRTWTVYDWCSPTTPDPPTTNPLYFIQVIKVLDQQGPSITCPANLTVSTDPFTCCVTTDLPDVIVSDNCSRLHAATARITEYDFVTNAVIGTVNLNGTLTTFAGNNLWNPDTLAAYGLTPCVPRGTHTVSYQAEDDCGNTATCSFRLTVADNTPPVPACDQFTNVSLGIDGTNFVNATTFDDGSYDNCSAVSFKARRMASSGCQSNGQFFDQVKFCCSDIGKTITVVLRVYDVEIPDGPVSLTFQEQHSNECMVQVFVEDKLKPNCLPPAHVTVSCENFDPSLWAYGIAKAADNCCVDTLTATASYATFDTACNKGTIIRTFRAVDCSGLSTICTQRVVVNYEQDYFVKFPNDVIVTACDGTGIYGEPTFFGKDCEQLGVSHEDEIFTVVPDACYKIERTWTIINWCTYNPNAGCINVPNPNPNATVNHPSNLPGPTVSPAGTPSPWNPTVVKINPTDPQNTNYSIYWDANANCYTYKQIIKIIDTQDPVIHCPPSPVVFEDKSPNDPSFWNEMYWWDGVHGSHDLCEGQADLCMSATDLCSGANLNIRYLLFLDLDNNGTMETVISSTNLPGYNTVYFNNANTPNFSGGTPYQFDGRPVLPNQKYGFAIQTTTVGVNRTACVRWNTQQQPGTYVVPELPYGVHKIKWIIEDGCGNETICEYTFEIKDKKAPTVVCLNGLSVNIMPTKMIALWANDFLQYTEDNCTPSNQIKIGIRKSGAGTGFPYLADGVTPQTGVTFDCTELGTRLVELWGIDKAGNADYCETYVIVQDNNKNCQGAGAASVAGALKTEADNGLEDATVTLTGSHPALPGGSVFDITDNQGKFLLNSIPFLGDYTLTPYKDNDPLNGVSTFDLVLMNKHILGLEPLNSPYKMIAADANNSRSITTFDIVELRKLILGIYTELPNNTSWRFLDKDYAFPNASNPFQEVFPETKQIANMQSSTVDENFVSVKVGDVNGNAVASSLLSADERSSGTLLFDVTPVTPIPDGRVKPGETFTLHFRAAEKVAGYQYTLYFPNLEVLDVTPGADMTPGNFGVFNSEHALTTSFDNGQVQGEFAVTFRTKAAAELNQLLAVSSRITKAEAYREPAADERLDVALRFNNNGTTTVSGLGFELYQNQPNPWLQRSQIGFYLPAAGAATLTVFDETGRTLYVQQGNYGKGYNAIALDRALFETAGVLYYKLETATESAVRKMIRIK